MGRICLCFWKISQAGPWWTMRKQSLRQSVIESILGVAESRQGTWVQILRKMIVNHRWHEYFIINYVASKFYPIIKIMILHSQRVNETHQCTRCWSFRLTSSRVTVWWLLQFGSDETCFWMTSCLKENVPPACNDAVSADGFYFQVWVKMNHCVTLKSLNR